ncbi:cytochrome P450 [Ketogulonicigenium robustum]|uniref:Cytochrome P450 n=1 Tax=Ketogulonicigenium robustum TaxID=92947 RepID=A0A1W6NZC5_9RHOB|nr:cytochrome P450 [Ketogulonicigenium robustum]ARO14521.1 cytochrome P450 [Ketogulonicigenium robustum]
MDRISQSPTDPAFVANPYAFYDKARAAGDMFYWTDYDLPCAVTHRAVSALLRDRRLGREAPPECAPTYPDFTRDFYALEAHSMLEVEPPRHTRLRGLVLRAFTSRRIAAMAPEIETLCHSLIDAFPPGPFDLLTHYAQHVPVTVIARLLGVPDSTAPRLLDWSNRMVGMYQARATEAVQRDANAAAAEFRAFMVDYIAQRRVTPGNDLLTELIAAEEDGEKLTTDELITTCILLLNAGHEATVHTIGNGIKTLIEQGKPAIDETSVEEIIRFDPPLHMFLRWVYEDVDLFGHTFRRGDRIACLLAAANHDPAAYDAPATFNPARKGPQNTSFGAGIHFCVGAPLARLELVIALRTLMARLPALSLAEAPRYSNVYHFHGLQRLMVTAR